MATRDGILDYIDTAYYWAYIYYGTAKDKLFDAYTGYEVESDHVVLGYLVDGCRDLYIAVGQLTTKADPIGGKAQIAYFLRYFTIDEAPAYELTMADLINAMLTADPDQVEYFVGLVDAYRQSMWNREYNHEFFAALARGFQEWP